MNTESNDPLFRGLHELAEAADSHDVPDRMAIITRRARVQRTRKLVVVGASLAVAAVGVAGALGPGGARSTEPAPIATPSAAPSQSPSAVPTGSTRHTKAAGLVIDLTVKQIARTTLGVDFRIHGKVPGWYTPPGETPVGYEGPGYSSVLLDGQEVGSSGYRRDQLKCRAGTPAQPVDDTWPSDDHKGRHVEVPGPGTYTVTVQAPYCGANGEIVENEVSQSVSVIDPELVVTDETSVDIDGDGQRDRIQLLMPKADQVTGLSAIVEAKVTRASGPTTEFPIYGSWEPTVAGEADLNDDGRPEVLVRSAGESLTTWTVLTFDDEQVTVTTPGEVGEGNLPQTGVLTDGSYQLTWLRKGRLTSWSSPPDWDRESATKVELSTWALDGARLSRDESTEVCVGADPKSWTQPNRC